MKYLTFPSRNQILGLGAVAGMRAMSAPALLSTYLHRYPSQPLSRSRLRFMQSGTTSTIFKLLAIGELIGDKLPVAPSRTEPGGLVGRALSGALVGATLTKASGAYTGQKEYAIGAGLGLLSAVASTFLFYNLRKQLADNTKLPDAGWGVAEDLLAIRGGRKLLRPKVYYVKKRVK